jgi:hypothetical protein
MTVDAGTVNIYPAGGGGAKGGSKPAPRPGSGGGAVKSALGIFGSLLGEADKGSNAIDSDSLLSKLLNTLGGKKYAAGGVTDFGIVPGGYDPGKDRHAAMLSGGEGVLNPNAARAVGYHNIKAANDRYPAGVSSVRDGVSYLANGGAILADAEKYSGHKYVWGGPSNPQTGWDCSSFVSYILGHDFGMTLPGGQSWAKETGSGSEHGPVASAYLSMPGAKNEGHNAAKIQKGDLLVWPGHVGFGAGPGKMFSAYDTASGTVPSPAQAAGVMTIMRLLGAVGTAAATGASASGSSAGSSGSAVSSSGSSGGIASGGGGSSPNSTSEAANIAAALSMGGGGVMIGTGSRGTTSANATSTNAGSGSSGGSSGGTATKGAMTAAQIQKLWTSLGGPAGAAGNMARIAYAESGDRPGITQAGVAAGVTGYGLYQITPTSGITQGGKYGNLLNASNNTRAAIELFRESGYRPWAADAVGASLSGAATGGTIQRSGPYVVGERGPEIAYLPTGSSVLSAKRTQVAGAQGVAQVPWKTGTAQSGTAGGGVNVNLTIASGAITIQQGTGTNSVQAASNSAREIVSKVQEMLKSEELYTAIANGNKRG